jgi:putative oxidoreductase
MMATSLRQQTIKTTTALRTMKTSFITPLLNTNDTITPLFLRIALGGIMFPHGAQKVLGWFGGYGFDGTMGFFTGTLHIPWLFALLAIVAEFFGSLALIAGLFTRVAAFGIAATMAVAALMAHTSNGFFMNWNGNQAGEGFEYHLLAIAIAVALIIQGGGKWALDSVVARKLSGSSAYY